MMRFVDQIHQAFRETIRSGSLATAQDLPARLRDLATPPEERDQIWNDVLQAYIAGPRHQWATIVLEAMCPDIAVAVAKIPAIPRAIAREEVAQQLITELLIAALDGPTQPARWSPNRLLSNATKLTYRWLAREIRSLSQGAGDLDRSHIAAAGCEIPTLLWELEARATPSAGLVILYRQEVLGESLAEIAAECGLSENAVTLRRFRAVRRLRRALATA
jgi:AcrR family transcriptional regulator